MNKVLKYASVSFFAFGIMILSGCKKEENAQAPSVTTRPVISIAARSATSGGIVNSDGGATINYSGVTWGTAHNPTTADNKTDDGTHIGSFLSTMTGLTANTTYYVRAYATNSAGTGYGNEVTFTTNQVALATVSTSDVYYITATAAFSGGIVQDDGGDDVTARGVCWSSTDQFPTKGINSTTDGAGHGEFASNIRGLSPNTTYYVRAYATNSAGTAYGVTFSFTTEKKDSSVIFNDDLNYGTVTDVELNIYQTIRIGDKIWMAENLRTTRFNNGSEIWLIADKNTWSTTYGEPAYSWYNNSQDTYKPVYGALYNWGVVESGMVCPTGWHVSTRDEFNALLAYLGGQPGNGGELKEVGLSHWAPPNTGATNGSGWTGVPGGLIDMYGTFSAHGLDGYWWSSTIDYPGYAFYGTLEYNSALFTVKSTHMQSGMSIRCVKD